jgi:hypothetical protein
MPRDSTISGWGILGDPYPYQALWDISLEIELTDGIGFG